eukprot:7000631-Prymnesium_polylepis.1
MHDFGNLKWGPDTQNSVICDQARVEYKQFYRDDGSVTWHAIRLNVLSSQTLPQHRPLRFKAVVKLANGSEL